MKVAELQIKQGIRPIKPPATGRSGQSQANKKGEAPSFGSVLQKQVSAEHALKFSAHALKRLESRSLPITEAELQRLDRGMQQLQAKGAKNSVILMDNQAFVVSVKNRTVVTALDYTQSNERIFTNIDSLAIV